MLHSETLHQTYVRPHASVVFTRLDDTEGVLLHLDTKRYYSLNETGAYLWERLEGGQSATALAQALHHVYDLTSEEALHVIRDFVATLQSNGLVDLQKQTPVSA